MATTFPIRANTQPAVRDIDGLIAALRKTGKEAGMSEDEINNLTAATKKAGTEGAQNVNRISKEVGALQGAIGKVGTAMLTLFAVDRLKAFVKEVVNITAEFQRLEAVLTNTLGSKSEAQASLIQIQKLAATTPFSVREITENFVKLANRGVKPTMDELKKMGDVAATLGKPFEQVVEAILDISNSERWREIGLQSEKAGDKVRLTFRGVTQEVEGTVEGVAKAVTKFGEMNGVAGATDVIIKTIGGRMSNFEDTLNQVLTRIGNENSGLIKGFIDLAGAMLDVVNISLSDPIGEKALENAETYRTALKEAFDKFKAGEGSDAINAAIADNVKFTNEWRESVNELSTALSSLENYIKAGYQAEDFGRLTTQLELERRTLALLEEMTQEYIDRVRNATTASNELTKEQLAWLEKLKTAKFELSGQDEKMVAVYRQQNTEIEQQKKLVDELLGSLARINAAQEARDKANQLPDLSGAADGLEPEQTDQYKGPTAEELAAEKQNLELQTYNQAVALSNSLFEIKQNNYRRELDALRFRYEQEIFLAGDNEDAKAKIAQDFQKKQFEIQNRAAKLEQQQAIFSILVNQGPAIAKTLSGTPYPYSLPLILLVAAQFGLLLSNQRKMQPPRFAADGKYGIEGPGTTTSDSIPFMLSREESVVQAERSKRFKALLKPLIESDNFDWADARSIIDKQLPNAPAAAIIVGQTGSDSNELLHEMRATRKAIENKKETRFSFDEHGFGFWMGKQGEWTKYVKGRYRM